MAPDAAHSPAQPTMAFSIREKIEVSRSQMEAEQAKHRSYAG